MLAAYEVGEGDMERVYEEVMLSNPLEDEERFRGVIDEAVGSGEVKRFKKYAEESEKDRKRRMKKARAEAEEAAELARELGVEDKLFGAGGGNGTTAIALSPLSAYSSSIPADALLIYRLRYEKQSRRRRRRGRAQSVDPAAAEGQGSQLPRGSRGQVRAEGQEGAEARRDGG